MDGFIDYIMDYNIGKLIIEHQLAKPFIFQYCSEPEICFL